MTNPSNFSGGSFDHLTLFRYKVSSSRGLKIGAVPLKEDELHYTNGAALFLVVIALLLSMFLV